MSKLVWEGDWPLWSLVVPAVLVSILIGGWYYRELSRVYGRSHWGLAAAAARVLSIWLVILMLAEPTLDRRQVIGRPGRLVVAVDSSASMQRSRDGLSRTAEASVWFKPGGPLDPIQLADRFRLQVVAGDGVAMRPLYASIPGAEHPEFDVATIAANDPAASPQVVSSVDNPTQTPVASEQVTALGAVLESFPDTTLVVLTDGRSTTGPNLTQTAADRDPNHPAFFVGIGGESPESDPRISAVRCPNLIDREDQLSGAIQYSTDGQACELVIERDDVVLWRHLIDAQTMPDQTAEISSAPSGEISAEDFALDVDAVLRAVSPSAVDRLEAQAVPIDLTARIVPLDRAGGETANADVGTDQLDAEPRNNSLDFRVWVSLIRRKALLLQARPNWEMRYVHNGLDRDPDWTVEVLTLGGNLQDRQRADEILTTASELGDFDVIVVSDLGPQHLAERQQLELERYVASGGGLIAVDGSLGGLRSERESVLAKMLPIQIPSLPTGATSVTAKAEWTDAGRLVDLYKTIDSPVDAAASGRNEASSAIRSTLPPAELNALWGALPPIQLAGEFQPSPAATVLATAETESGRDYALLVQQRLGGGTVLYVASEQLWRWRYGEYEQLHWRFWNQAILSVARQPFLLSGERVAIDAPLPQLQAGEPIPLRVKLNPEQFPPRPDRLVQAVVKLADSRQVVGRYQMQCDDDLPGHYQATLPPLPGGHYKLSVETADMTADDRQVALDLKLERDDQAEVMQTDTDFAALRAAADASSAVHFIPGDDQESLRDALESLATARVVRNRLPLWQSWWLFVPLVTLLAAEWLIRKKIGLP